MVRKNQNRQRKSHTLKQVYDYVDAVINIDVSRVDSVEKNPQRVRALMRSLARNISTMANITTIQNDIAGDDHTISDKTISVYLNALNGILSIHLLLLPYSVLLQTVFYLTLILLVYYLSRDSNA